MKLITTDDEDVLWDRGCEAAWVNLWYAKQPTHESIPLKVGDVTIQCEKTLIPTYYTWDHPDIWITRAMLTHREFRGPCEHFCRDLSSSRMLELHMVQSISFEYEFGPYSRHSIKFINGWNCQL